ncbi:MAG: hypothetical protein IKE30_04390 [Clostridia bacterium]|nr:hypothetical protein [Clostridia bacterium]
MDQKTSRDLTTSRLLSRIRAAGSPQEAVAWHDAYGDPLLKDTLYMLMQKNSLQPRDVILECGLERSYFYHILSGHKRPSRNMMLRIGFCVRADYEEMNHLLRLSGVSSLYPRIRRDALIIYAIQQKLSMEAANALLAEQGEVPLYREETHA